MKEDGKKYINIYPLMLFDSHVWSFKRSVFFEKIESDLTQRICVKLGPCTTLVACA